jgi:hypothetical protein
VVTLLVVWIAVVVAAFVVAYNVVEAFVVVDGTVV